MQFRAQGGIDLVGAGQMGGEGVQPFMIPAHKHFLAAAGEKGDEDLDRLALADAVEAANALLEQFGIGGQIKEEEVVAELEIPAFAADLRADEQARPVGVGEPGGVAVALQQREMLMKQRHLDIDQLLQGRRDGARLFRGVTDQQHLDPAVLAHILSEPDQAGIVAQVRGLAGLPAPVAWRPCEGDQLHTARRKVVQLRTGIPKDGAAGAGTVDYFGDELFAFRLFLPQQPGESGAFPLRPGRRERGKPAFLPRGQPLHGDDFVEDGDLPGVLLFLLFKLFQIAVFGRIEQPQTGEMAGPAQLFRCCGYEQHAGGGGAERARQIVGRSRIDQMMGLIDHQHVPASRRGQRPPFRTAGQQLHAAEYQLILEKGILIGLHSEQGFDLLLIVEAEDKIEAAQELDKPLVHQRFGYQDEDAVDAADGEQPVQDKGGLDGLAQTGFVGEEHPGIRTGGDGVGHIELVRDQIDAAAEESAQGGTAIVVAVAQGAVAQQVFGVAVDIEVEQAVARSIKADGIGEHLLARADRFTAVAQQAVMLFGGEDDKGAPVAEGDGIAGAEDHAAQRGRCDGETAGAAAGGEINGDHAAVGSSDRSQPQFGLHLTDPALTDLEHGFPDSPARINR